MVTLWLWDADGPLAGASGVTDNPAAARRAAADAMAANEAAIATVQQATHRDGGGWMRSGYTRTATGWTATRNGTRTQWTPLNRHPGQPAS